MTEKYVPHLSRRIQKTVTAERLRSLNQSADRFHRYMEEVRDRLASETGTVTSRVTADMCGPLLAGLINTQLNPLLEDGSGEGIIMDDLQVEITNQRASMQGNGIASRQVLGRWTDFEFSFNSQAANDHSGQLSVTSLATDPRFVGPVFFKVDLQEAICNYIADVNLRTVVGLSTKRWFALYSPDIIIDSPTMRLENDSMLLSVKKISPAF